MDSREEDIQMRQMMMKEATGMDLIMVVISVLFEKGFLALLKGVFGRLETL